LFLRIVLFFIILCGSKVYAECNFISSDFIKELNNPDNIKEIQINTANTRKYYKNQLNILISNDHVIPQRLKKNYAAKVRVIYSFGECVYKAKIRQHGDWKDHIYLDGGTPISSLRVNLENGNIINTVKFKLLIPSTRNNLNEVLGSLLLKYVGFIVPETFQVKTSINGVNILMLFQEVVRKELLERNNRREGPILEGDESILWSDKFFVAENQPLALSRVVNEKWFLKGENSAKITLDAFRKLQIAYLEYAQNIKDMKYILIKPNFKSTELFAKYFFSLAALNGNHALVSHNRKFYYNSFTEKFEPIYYDGNLSLQKKITIESDTILAAKNFYGTQPFKYQKSFSKLENEKKILKDFKDRTQVNDAKALKFFNKSMSNIKSNENIIQSLITSSQNNNLWKRDIKRDFDNYLSNLSLLPKLKQTTIIKIYEDNNKFTSLTTDNQKLYLTNNDVAEIISKNKLNDFRYVYVPNDTNSETINTDIKIVSDFSIGYLKHSKTLSVKIDDESKIIHLKQNKTDDWALFVDVNLNQWTILFEGVKPTQKKNDLATERVNRYGLTGCLNFYKSIFNNSSITVSDGECEDSLNIINSKGTITNIDVKNAFSDALDVDFSNIEFGTISITLAGNDCLDVSAGKYKISKLVAIKCGDKGVSVGEKSNMDIGILNVNNALIGLSSKDLSITSVKHVIQKNVKNCFEVSQKKQEFGGARLTVGYMNCDSGNIVDTNSKILINKL